MIKQRKKKGQVLAGMFLSVVLLTTGCNKEDDTESTEYVLMEGLNNAIAASMLAEADIKQTEKPEADLAPLVQEAAGDEDIEERKICEATNIYSKPDEKGTVIGSVEQNDTVQIIGIMEEEAWYKIVHKGRVAYISAEAVEEGDDDFEWKESMPTQRPIATSRPTPEPTSRPSTNFESIPEATPRPGSPSTPSTQRPTWDPTFTPKPPFSSGEPTSTAPGPEATETPIPTPGPTATPTMPPTPEPTTIPPTLEPTPEPTPELTPEPTPTQEPAPEPTPEPTPTQEPALEPTPEPTPTQEPAPEPTLKPTQEPMPESIPEPPIEQTPESA